MDSVVTNVQLRINCDKVGLSVSLICIYVGSWDVNVLDDRLAYSLARFNLHLVAIVRRDSEDSYLVVGPG